MVESNTQGLQSLPLIVFNPRVEIVFCPLLLSSETRQREEKREMRDCRRRKKGPAWVRRHRHRSEFVAIVTSLSSSPSSPIFTHRHFVLLESILLLRTPLSPLQSQIRTQPPELMVQSPPQSPRTTQSPLVFAPPVLSLSLSLSLSPDSLSQNNRSELEPFCCLPILLRSIRMNLRMLWLIHPVKRSLSLFPCAEKEKIVSSSSSAYLKQDMFLLLNPRGEDDFTKTHLQVSCTLTKPSLKFWSFSLISTRCFLRISKCSSCIVKSYQTRTTLKTLGSNLLSLRDASLNGNILHLTLSLSLTLSSLLIVHLRCDISCSKYCSLVLKSRVSDESFHFVFMIDVCYCRFFSC